MRIRGTWATVTLLVLMQLSLAWSIDNAEWVPGLWILTPIVVGGVLIGAVLASIPWMPVLVAHGWSILAGGLGTVYLSARTLDRYAHVDGTWFAQAGVVERMTFVRDWYLGWLSSVKEVTNAPYVGTLEADMATLFAAVTLGLLLWLLAYISTWFALRYFSWPGAVLPAGFALVFNLASAKTDNYATYLGFFLLCAFLLAARMHIGLQLERWRAERIGHSAELEFDLLRDALVVSLAMIAFGLLLPGRVESAWLADLPSRWSSVNDGAQRFSSTYFPSLNYPSRGGGNAFGEHMPLTGAIQLGDNPVFDVRVDPASEAGPRYWRMAIFDTWDGQGWHRNVEAVEDGEALDLAPDWLMTVPVTQTIRTLKAQTRQLYAAPQPDSFDIPVRAEVAGRRQDVLTVSSREPLPINESYRAVSRVSVADRNTLRAIDTAADPDWVSARYLEVPPAVTERVHELAADITVDSSTRYDKAKAIESWLRREMVYQETISDPPEDRDKVDWFLFEERAGYCDYYSSAFVMMARSVGIPSRIAAGYAGGSPVAGDPTAQRLWDYDAHTWPEVFFPQLGWIEFEPTAGEPPLDRAEQVTEERDPIPPPDRGPDDRLDDLLPDEFSNDETAPATQPQPERVVADGGLPLRWLLMGLVAMGMIATAGKVFWQRPLRGLSGVESAFLRLIRVASWLGLRPAVSETPSEYGRRLGGVIPDARGEIHTLADAYVKERFGRRSGIDLGMLADAAWRRLRVPLVRRGALRHIKGLIRQTKHRRRD